MKINKETIIKNLNGIFSVLSILALLFPFFNVGAESSYGGMGADVDMEMNGITFVQESGLWGIIFLIAIVAILLFTYLKQLNVYKKIVCVAAPVLMLLSLFLGINAASAGANAGADMANQLGSVAGVESDVDISYGIGLWIALLSSICLLTIGVINYFNLKGNTVFDTINSGEDENNESNTEFNMPNVDFGVATEKLGNIVKNVTESLSQNNGDSVEKEHTENVQEMGNVVSTSSNTSNPIIDRVDSEYVMEKLDKLFEMKEKGILTEQEFSDKKAELLKQI